MRRAAPFRAAFRVLAGVLFLAGTGCGGGTARNGAASQDAGARVDADGASFLPAAGESDGSPDDATVASDASADADAESSGESADAGDAAREPSIGAGGSTGARFDSGEDGPAGDTDANTPARALDATTNASACNGGSCSVGCCDALRGCQPGTADDACGQSGDCTDCADRGLVCLYLECAFWSGDGGLCSGQTCPSGCCDFEGKCEQGLVGTACGNFGANCLDCTASGETCTNQACAIEIGAPACSDTCAGCCDAKGSCSSGDSNTLCGGGGQPCTDCAAIGAECQSGSCVALDGGSACNGTCSSCCDRLGNCQFGLLDTQCGAGFPGGPCQDCTRLSPPSTCDVNLGVCASQETCPRPYAGCPAALEEAPPVRQHVCSANVLQNVAAACASGGCAIDFEAQLDDSDLPCLGCLENFAFDTTLPVGPGGLQISRPHSMQDAIRSCAAPYVDAACNHNSGCIVDCLTEACYDCYSGPDTCEASAQAGTCATYFAADACATQALAGSAAFCNPDTYHGNYGLWLQAVATSYCGE